MFHDYILVHKQYNENKQIEHMVVIIPTYKKPKRYLVHIAKLFYLLRSINIV